MTTTISNSEAETYNTCERMHYYKFALGLQPRRSSHFIRIGVVGHKVLETYYRCGLETNNDKRAMYLAAIDELAEFSANAKDEGELEIIDLVSSRINSYIRHYRDTWRVIAVEDKYFKRLTEDIEFGMTLDLLVEETEGPLRGQHIVIDHKFCYNFQTAEELQMNSQVPKYISVLREHGFNVKRGMLNQIRYRGDIQDTEKLFKRSTIKPSDYRLDGIMNEQLKVSQEILANVSMPVSVYRDVARRSMSKRNCGSCQFRLPCSLELDGRENDASTILAMDYVGNTYGYRG